MTFDLFIALVLFAFVTSITPGPNNIMLLSSGMNYGFRRSIPHMLGIAIGFMLMIFLMGLGLDRIFISYPILHKILRYISIIYMLWLAWKIANSTPMTNDIIKGKPMTFFQAALFQWVNPKAWVMAISAIITYVPVKESLWPLIWVTLIFGIINLPSVGIWALFGTGLRAFLSDKKHLRIFNYLMATLLVLSLFPLFVSGN
jgi:threonine/homoserine/homoserine lactone efflux protein